MLRKEVNTVVTGIEGLIKQNEFSGDTHRFFGALETASHLDRPVSTVGYLLHLRLKVLWNTMLTNSRNILINTLDFFFAEMPNCTCSSIEDE